jgi:hypothetical protein
VPTCQNQTPSVWRGFVMQGAVMLPVHSRPCYFDGGIVCDDCDGRPATCARLIAQDQAEDDDG